MKLTELDPSFVGMGGDGVTDREGRPVPRREGVALAFDCPLGASCSLSTPTYKHRHVVNFANPLDGGPPVHPTVWHRTGDTFETLSLTPSILSRQGPGGCGWHGFIGSAGAAPGEVKTVP